MRPKSSSWFSWRLFAEIFAVLAFLSIVAVAGIAGLVKHYTSEIPSLEDLRTISPTLSTRILDKDEKPFGEFFVERRNWCPLDSIPPVMRQAVLSIEDRKFYHHWGINLKRDRKSVV